MGHKKSRKKSSDQSPRSQSASAMKRSQRAARGRSSLDNRRKTRTTVVVGSVLVVLLAFLAATWYMPHFLRTQLDAQASVIYMAPEDPNVFSKDPYGTHIGVTLTSGAEDWLAKQQVIPSDPVIRVEAMFSLIKPSGYDPSTSQFPSFKWKLYVPEGATAYRVLKNGNDSTETGIYPFSEWIPIDPSTDQLSIPTVKGVSPQLPTRVGVLVVVEVKVSAPATSAGTKDGKWAQSWKVVWKRPPSAPKLPTWTTVIADTSTMVQSPKYGSFIWVFQPDLLKPISTSGQVDLYSCWGCETLNSYGDAKEVSRGFFANATLPNETMGLEVSVPWLPWSWASEAAGWILLALIGATLATGLAAAIAWFSHRNDPPKQKAKSRSA